MSHRVSIPVTIGVSWVMTVPEVCIGESRPATPASLRELEEAFAPADDDHDEVDWFELLARYAFECDRADRPE